MSISELRAKIVAFKKQNPQKGALKRKIKQALALRIKNQYVSFVYKFHRQKLNAEQTERILKWKWYVYLKRKYSRFLESLTLPPMPENQEIPKILWWCWLQGEENAPPLCRACLNSLRRNMSGYEIRIVTEKNMWDLISVPGFIRKKYEKGIIPRTQFSDLLRTCLVLEHGGIWVDSTVLCTGNIPPVQFDKHLFIYQNYKRGDESICLSTWLIAACSNEPGLALTRELLLEYWRRNNSLCHYFIYHFFFTMVCERYPQVLESVPRYSNLPPHILQFEMFKPFDSVRWEQIKGMSAFHKLSWKYDTDSIDVRGTYYEHVLQEYGEKRL
ncbi:MAG: hypothetical protein IJ558_09385 [Treponema sp.]|nr:hypothetical protein [Treponema sp.]